MIYSLERSPIFDFKFTWDIENLHFPLIQFQKPFFTFTLLESQTDDNQGTINLFVEYTPSTMATIKTVNCNWNCKVLTAEKTKIIASNSSTSNLELYHPVKLLQINSDDIHNQDLIISITISYCFVKLINKGLSRVDYSSQMLSPYGIASDCQIVVGDTTFKIHSFMITSASDIFYAALTQLMISSQYSLNGHSENQDKLDIHGFHPNVVLDAIKFIYGSKLEQAYYELYKFAVLYRIRQLMDFCELYFEKNLGPNNVIPIYQLSLDENRGHLRHFCVVYYKANKDAVHQAPSYINASEELRESLLIPFVLGP